MVIIIVPIFYTLLCVFILLYQNQLKRDIHEVFLLATSSQIQWISHQQFSKTFNSVSSPKLESLLCHYCHVPGFSHEKYLFIQFINYVCICLHVHNIQTRRNIFTCRYMTWIKYHYTNKWRITGRVLKVSSGIGSRQITIDSPLVSRNSWTFTHPWMFAVEWLGPLVIVSGDPTCTDLITQPELRWVLSNQKWGFVGVSVTSWDQMAAGISANQEWICFTKIK